MNILSDTSSEALICILDSQGAIIDHNSTFDLVLGYSKDSSPRSILDLVPKSEKISIIQGLQDDEYEGTLKMLDFYGDLHVFNWRLQKLSQSFLSIKSVIEKTSIAGELAEGPLESLSLTPTQHKILSLFIEAAGSEVSRERITKSVWENLTVHPKTLNVHLTQIRRSLRGTGFDIVNCARGIWKLSKTNLKY